MLRTNPDPPVDPKTSWNPFQRIKVYLAEAKAQAAEIAQIKAELKAQCLIPREFLYTQPENLEEKVIFTACGHVFSVEQAKQYQECPEDKKPIETVEAKSITKIVTDFKKQYQKINKTINDFSSNKKEKINAIEWAIANFNVHAIQLADKIAEYRNLLLTRNHLKLQIRTALDAIPNELSDTIDLELLDNPVLTHCGHVFSRCNLDRWLKTSSSCPICREKFNDGDLKDPAPSYVGEGDFTRELKRVAVSEEDDLRIKVKNLFVRFVYARSILEFTSLTEAEVKAAVASYETQTKMTVERLEQYKTEMRFLSIKRNLRNECKVVPPEIGDLPDDPVLWKTGLNCQSRSGLLRVRRTDFIEDKAIDNFVANYRVGQRALLQSISEMKIEEHQAISRSIADFKANKIQEFQKIKELVSIRQNLRNEGMVVPHEIGELSDDPVLWKTGLNCRSRSGLLRVHHTDFIEDKAIDNFVANYRVGQRALLQSISEMKIEEHQAISRSIADFKANKIQEFQNIKKKILNDRVIANLKLDRKNVGHLQFWQDQVDPCCHGYGGVGIGIVHQATEQIFRVPTRIQEMMRLATLADSYADHDAFMTALNQARHKRPYWWWNNPLSWVARTPVTSLVYEITDDGMKSLRVDDDIKRLRMQ